ncbi:PD-(D/E)XK motif protein [Lacisediminimonas profundi]|uniref:PD-(D/E)XK motif protein n=1 Tax=Lacisediminimonas profundi TaxID=2603856 RepID=UPI001386672D|nr:PD-(D/E)XK motif protein [Lacisediminimonas profundi]
MANMLEARWDSLALDPLRPIFQLCDASHPLDFYIGKDPEQHKLLLLVTREVPPAIRDMRAIRIRTFRRDDGKWSILLTLDSASLAPMFCMLCNDLIESSRNTGLPVDKSLSFVLKRLSNWRRLLERGLPSLLSQNEIRGLCGELLFLSRLFAFLGKAGAVKAWVGPQQADQDFQAPEAAWEVKTIQPGAHSVIISSELQLQTTIRPLHLAVFELAESIPDGDGSFTLNTLTDRIRQELADDHDAADLFEANMAAAGYVPRPEYDAPAFVERSLSMFAVSAEFPRITGEMLAPGISHVAYNLKLAVCEKFRIAEQSLTSQRDH